MRINGFELLLQDYCQECPDFKAEVETITVTTLADNNPRAHHNIRCENRKRCARIVENISKRTEL